MCAGGPRASMCASLRAANRASRSPIASSQDARTSGSNVSPRSTRVSDCPGKVGRYDFDAITGALHRLRHGDELIERLAPALAEAHAIVRITILLVLMHGKRGVFRSFSVRLHHDDRSKGRNIEGGIGWPVAGRKRHGPDELAVRHDLEETADIRDVLTFRRAHHRAEDAAGAKVDFAIDRFPRRRREPFLDMRGHGPRRPYELGRDVDHALQNEIKPRIVLDGSGHFVSSFSSIRYVSS